MLSVFAVQPEWPCVLDGNRALREHESFPPVLPPHTRPLAAITSHVR